MSEPRAPRILIVDDEAAQMRALCDTLRDHGYETVGFTSGTAALAELPAIGCELLLADLMMPGMDGIALMQAAQAVDPDLVGIIMTGEGTIATAVEAMKAGALDYILKPFKLSVILPVLSRALTVRRLRIDNAELERRVRERTAELEAVNKELEAFTYSVSHDLRGPLTVIIGQTDMLIEDYGSRMPAGARPLLDSVLAGGERMVRLIDGLLRLSRVGHLPLARRPVDVATLVGEVLADLRGAPGIRPVDIRLGELPGCVGDPALLRQVFANLLSNACKFSRLRDHPVIEVTCRRESGAKVYSVRDNGAGFDMGRAQDLFGAFRRFHDAGQFEGSGIGLSIVQRIVERHGGRVWAEAVPDRGATFHVSLPD